jgi:hypothetical protein
LKNAFDRPDRVFAEADELFASGETKIRDVAALFQRFPQEQPPNGDGKQEEGGRYDVGK